MNLNKVLKKIAIKISSMYLCEFQLAFFCKFIGL